MFHGDKHVDLARIVPGWVKFGSPHTRAYKLQLLSHGGELLREILLQELLHDRSRYGSVIPVYYSRNGLDFFLLSEGVTIIADLKVEHVTYQQRSYFQAWELPVSDKDAHYELLVTVRNGHANIGYFCDIEGTNMVTRAWLTTHLNG